MTKRLCLSLALVAVATLLIAVPVLAAYYAYIYVSENNGNSYDSLPLICTTNITPLIQGDFMSSTGLDTRVLTGDGYPLPHMLAEDKVLFVSDLAAYEDKTLIFYLGATSLSSFPIIPGYGGYITTDDDPDLELTYVIELLASGYFDASVGTNKSILYKQNTFKMNISAANTLRVAALEAGDVEQWEMHYSSFTSGEHIVYVIANGLGAYLYVDDFDVAKDTANLYETNTSIISTDDCNIFADRPTFYANGRYWAFWQLSYALDPTHIYWSSSTDGSTWSAASSITLYSGDAFTSNNDFAVWYRDGYVHLAYQYGSTTNHRIRYRMGEPQSDGSINWSTGDWVVAGSPGGYSGNSFISVDESGYPYILYNWTGGGGAVCYTSITKSSTKDGTWVTAGGYPINIGSTGTYDHDRTFVSYPNSDKMYVLWNSFTGAGGPPYPLYGRYYNGSSWAGSDETIASDARSYSLIADNEDRVYITYSDSNDVNYLKIRYADGSFSSPITITDSGSKYMSASYNDRDNVVYFIYNRSNYMRCKALADWAITAEYTLFSASLAAPYMATTPYGTMIGILHDIAADLKHGYLSFPYEWNDNSNDWLWMQNNCMSYADDFQIAIDGTLQLEYKPATIIQDDLLPDEEGDHDGTITWGTNPDGVDVSISELQFEQSYNETYYYQYLNPGSTDIIKPEPETMVGDVDIIRLRDNPLYPLVQVLTIAGFLTERLAWLGIAWLIVIAAMFLVHLGFDTRKGTEKPQHFILTTITGLGLSILFYAMGIFPLWVVILMSFGLIAAIIWERQPVM